MKSAMLEVERLEKRFDGVRALAGFSCTVREQEILGLIGPNGAGKTTFFNALTGFVRPDGGQAAFRGQALIGLTPYKAARIGVARTFQILRLIRRLSVLENVLLTFPNQAGERLRNVFFRPWTCRRQEAGSRKSAEGLLEEVGLAEKRDDLAEALSYGQQKLLSLVCCLATGAELLLLDEPVAGIAPEMIERILEAIRGLPRRGKSVVLIEHNIGAITQVCDRVVFMDAGAKVSEGTPEEVRNDPRVIEAYLD